MTKFQLTTVSESMAIQDIITLIDRNASQVALVVDANDKLAGTITDGDVRRALLRGRPLSAPASEIMNPSPVTLHESVCNQTILSVMKQKQIRDIPLLDNTGRVTRIVSLSDFLHTTAKTNCVVIMAGGIGSRLMPLTADTPKPMLSIGDRPILLRIIESLVEAGFERCYISVNYKADVIESFFGDGSHFGIHIEYLREKERLGTAGALSLLPHIPSEPILVMNGDVLTHLHFDSLLRFHEENHSIATMCATTHEVRVPFGVIDSDGVLVKGIREKPVQQWLVNAGIYLLQPSCLSQIPSNTYYDMTTLMGSLVERNERVTTFPIHEYWIDVGSPEDFSRAGRDLHTNSSE